jgi:dTDP-4-dehydrorhamnose 3,5-epimerase
MIYHDTSIAGVFLIETERHKDARGWFSRTYCAEEFSSKGLETNFAQCSSSFNEKRGTLRGLHYQTAPYAECKLVRCISGAIFDVVVDIRPDSATYGQWIAEELSISNGSMLYIPQGCAHGFQTLAPNSEIFYQITTPYMPDHASGIRWDDPGLAIDWPLANPILSDKDSDLPNLANSANGGPASGGHQIQAAAEYASTVETAGYG